MTDLIPSPAVVSAAADLFVPPTQGSGGYAVPCTSLKILPWELGVQLIRVTLSDRFRHGLITLQGVEATKLLVMQTHDVVVHMTPNIRASMPRAGMAGWLAGSILQADVATDTDTDNGGIP